MNSSTRIFATLSLAAATGKKIQNIGKVEHDKKAQRLGRELQLVGRYAVHRYPAGDFTPQKIMDIYDSVVALISGPTDPPVILSMLIAGLSDIIATCDKKRRKLIERVINGAQECLDIYPFADTDHDAAWAQYERWVA